MSLTMSRNSRFAGYVEHPYQAGDICSFRTFPATQFSSKNTRRYAALKVLGVKDQGVGYVVLDGVFPDHPDLEQVSGLQ
jgi:hypothetical protein